MLSEKIRILQDFIKIGHISILVEGLPASLINDAVILSSNCDATELNGHYEGAEFLPPKWYATLMQKSKLGACALIIDNINAVEKSEQKKFLEIIKYRKVATFELPANCTIIATCFDLKNKPIDSEVYSYFAHI